MHSGSKIGIIIVMIVVSMGVMMGFTPERGIYPTGCGITQVADRQMIFQDTVTSKALRALVGEEQAHSRLTGRGDDEHLLYYNQAGLSENLGATNSARPGWDNVKSIKIEDVKGTRTLEEHLKDGDIHWLRPAQVVTVAKDGTGMYTSIQEAIDSITDSSPTKPYVVLVYPGVYEETVSISKSYISLIGVDKASCQIKKNQFVGGNNVASGIIRLYASHVGIMNLTIYNTHDVWGKISPAIISGKRVEDVEIVNCNLFSNSKDTVFLTTSNAFGSCRLRGCYIKGTYDILTVNGSVWAQDCIFKIISGSSSAVLFFNTSATCMINNCFIDMTNQSSGNSQIFATGGGTIYYLNNAVRQSYHRRLLTPNSSNITIYAYGSPYTKPGGDGSCVIITDCVGKITSLDLKVKGNARLGDAEGDRTYVNGYICAGDHPATSEADKGGTVYVADSLKMAGNLTVNKSSTLGNGGDLTTVKDALKLNPISNWKNAEDLEATDEGTMYYDSDDDKVFVCSDIGGTFAWEGVAYMSDLPCPQLYVYGANYPTTRVLWHRSGLLAGCIGQENEDVDEVEVSGAGFCKYAFVIAEKQDATAYFKDIALKVGDARLRPCRVVGGKREGNYLVLRKGEKCEIVFPQEKIQDADSVMLQVTGYYEIGKNANGLHKALRRMAKKMSVMSRMLRPDTKDDNEAVNGEIYWTPEGELHAKRRDGKVFRINLEMVK